MSIRWDSVLVRQLVMELDDTLSGARLRALRLDGASRDLMLLFRDRTLWWRLHPQRGALGIREAVEPDPSDLRLRARLRSVHAPVDERIVRFQLLAERGARNYFEIVVELVGNRLNAIVTEGREAVIRHVLVRREGKRPLVVGQEYSPPSPTDRDTSADATAWATALADIPPEERAKALVRGFAWTSPLNAPTILGATAEAADGGAADAAFGPARARWHAFVEGREPEPVLLETAGGLQPYPFPLTGVTTRPVPSLLAAFEACAEEAEERGDAQPALTISPELLASLDDAVSHHERRLARLRSEFASVEDPAPLRALGDLILARYGEIPHGADAVELEDFTGATVSVTLDPKLRPNENADRYYARANRAVRAADRLPGLIDEAEGLLTGMQDRRARAIAGDADLDEVRAALPAPSARSRRPGAANAPPYRSFRSSGGLEIRVGRGAKHNDALTFHHSSPGDVWLHARHTAGAHVVLRWTGDGSPPARDLEEAAVLAAVHSKARTSGSVPVDWTFRKYVRKPRGAPPGSVLPDRVKTVFVEPDEALIDALADGDSA